MVVIQIKKSDTDSFLYETTCETSNDTLIRELCEINNLRVRLRQLGGALAELGRYGPMKPPDKAGLDEVNEKYAGGTVDKNENYQADPTGIRTGCGPGPRMVEVFEQVWRDAEAALDPSNVQRKIATSLSVLQEKLDNIRGAVTMAYPMGLPEWDTVQLTINGIGGLDGTAAGQEIIDGETAELWVATRIFDRSQTVADRLGRNEKTKVIGKLQKPGAGAPCREPGVSEEEKKAMMAFYFKKQEEMKKLAEAEDDEYLHSSWADPKKLQKSLRGQGEIRAPGLR